MSRGFKDIKFKTPTRKVFGRGRPAEEIRGHILDLGDYGTAQVDVRGKTLPLDVADVKDGEFMSTEDTLKQYFQDKKQDTWDEIETCINNPRYGLGWSVDIFNLVNAENGFIKDQFEPADFPIRIELMYALPDNVMSSFILGDKEKNIPSFREYIKGDIKEEAMTRLASIEYSFTLDGRTAGNLAKGNDKLQQLLAEIGRDAPKTLRRLALHEPNRLIEDAGVYQDDALLAQGHRLKNTLLKEVFPNFYLKGISVSMPYSDKSDGKEKTIIMSCVVHGDHEDFLVEYTVHNHQDGATPEKVVDYYELLKSQAETSPSMIQPMLHILKWAGTRPYLGEETTQTRNMAQRMIRETGGWGSGSPDISDRLTTEVCESVGLDKEEMYKKLTQKFGHPSEVLKKIESGELNPEDILEFVTDGKLDELVTKGKDVVMNNPEFKQHYEEFKSKVMGMSGGIHPSYKSKPIESPKINEARDSIVNFIHDLTESQDRIDQTAEDVCTKFVDSFEEKFIKDESIQIWLQTSAPSFFKDAIVEAYTIIEKDVPSVLSESPQVM